LSDNRISVAEIEHAELLVWWLASISLVCVMLSQALLNDEILLAGCWRRM